MTIRAWRHGARLGILAAALSLSAAHAAVTISSDATTNMTCSGGVCAPTAADAILNAGDLETLLASGSVTVTTTGAGVQASDIVVAAPVSWSTGNTLGLDAYDSVAVDAVVSIAGRGGVTVQTNGGTGTLSFGKKDAFRFANLASTVVVNGVSFMLVNSVRSLAAAIAANPRGAFALANNYNAAKDGTYEFAPVLTFFGGEFEGLGNAIANLTIATKDNAVGGIYKFVGLFSYSRGEIDNIDLENENVSATRHGNTVGGLVAFNMGTISGSSVSGKVAGGDDQNVSFAEVGGLVGDNYGTIASSHVKATVTGNSNVFVGGLVGKLELVGTILNSSATGDVSVGGVNTAAGGLVGVDAGAISASFASGHISGGKGAAGGGLVGPADQIWFINNSYATGAVTASGNSSIVIGGFVGYDGGGNDGTYNINDCYASGAVSASNQSALGGFAGYVFTDNTIANAYWDTTTSGTDTGVGGGFSTGITGLTTAQLQSGLPAGFDPSVWAENPNINGGLPYLIANPPPS